MNDINPIILWFPINISYSLVFILFLVWLYILWKYLDKQKIPEKIIKTDFWNVWNLEDYKKQLNILEKKYLNIKKDVFYSKLSEILRNIIRYKSKRDISKMTFSEIQKLKINKNLLELIKNIYFKEYAKKIEDSEEIRKNLILEIKKLI